METFPAPLHELPSVDAAQMKIVDRLMIETCGIALALMMENAGRNLAALARDRFLTGDVRGRRVIVMAGSGNNGGGALVAARRLHAWGADVGVLLAHPAARLGPASSAQYRILQQLDVSCGDASTLRVVRPVDSESLIIDGLVGYGLKGALRGEVAELVRWSQHALAPVLALDVPSGLDPSTGQPTDPTVCAAATMTLALPKCGLRGPAVTRYVGELYLADIGVPPSVYAQGGLGLRVTAPFSQAEILRLV